ncbi:MAG: pantetheine-phosphate adenylyltransferase [Clostridiales bacterium]|jgi:pantetheine-phosphate adenylyltransferase|nr:pantetheine-phosphate adenylyltransferase [Clostridiales bacterium]
MNNTGGHTAVFAGTFDPFTLGHRELVLRAVGFFDTLYVLVAEDRLLRKAGMFSAAQRLELAALTLADVKNVEVRPLSGLLTEEMRRLGAGVMVRGLRNAADFDYEKNLFSMYRATDAAVECLYLMAEPALAHVSGSFVRDLIRFSGDFGRFVHPAAAARIKSLVV